MHWHCWFFIFVIWGISVYHKKSFMFLILYVQQDLPIPSFDYPERPSYQLFVFRCLLDPPFI